MRIRCLGWCGVEIDHDGHTLVIDYIRQSFPPLPPIFADGRFPHPLRPGGATAALVTHLHSAHADPHALAAVLADGAAVFRPEPNPGANDALKLTAPTEAQFAETGLRTEIVGPWEERRVGPFRLMAAPAVDGFGDPQRTWIVECGGNRILHAGDTLFHGHWWSIAEAVGPVDVAFLPINGPVVSPPGLETPSPFPAAMLPEEAAVAARMLRARVAVPIHYGTLYEEPGYAEAPRAAERFVRKAGELGVEALIPVRGEWFSPA